MGYHFIDPDKIRNMLFDDADYIIEFCEAGVSSFEEFQESYQKHLMNRNIEDLRKAGHKIKPGAEMMGAEEVIEEYEHAKTLLNNGANQNDLLQSIDKMKEMCSGIQEELSDFADNQR